MDDESELVNRLRGIVNVPVNDGCGPLNGSNVFTRYFETNPLQRAAADYIEALEQGEPVHIESAEKLIVTLETPALFMGLPEPYVPPIHTRAAQRLRDLLSRQ